MSDSDFSGIPKPEWAGGPKREFAGLSKKQFGPITEQRQKGEIFGLEFPFTCEQLREGGAAWLTEAFHAAGTLPTGNRVTELEVTTLAQGKVGQMGGAADKGALHVAYANPDEELHTDLFVKIPTAFTSEGDNMRYFNSVKQDMELYEIYLHWLLGHGLPFKVPKFYFADISQKSSNFIIISERIPYAQKGTDRSTLAPGEIEPCADKFRDYTLPRNGVDYYYATTAALARMTAWCHSGRLGSEERLFRLFPRAFILPGTPVPPTPVEAQAAHIRREAGILDIALNFVANVAPQLFPAAVRDPEFLRCFHAESLHVQQYAEEIEHKLSESFEHWSLIHGNCQLDNCFFWRNSEGVLECGLLDWGGVSLAPYTRALSGVCWIAAESEVMAANEGSLIRHFIDEYQKAGGPCAINYDDMSLRVKLGLAKMATFNMQTIMKLLQVVKSAEWSKFESLMDPELEDSFLLRSGIKKVLNNLEMWKSLKLYEAFLAWPPPAKTLAEVPPPNF